MPNLSREAYRHMKTPKGIGTPDSIDLVVQCGSEEQGPFFVLYIQRDAQKQKVLSARFRTFGCPWATACGSAMVEWIVGRSLTTLSPFDEHCLEQMLGDVPRNKLYCLTLAVGALRDALRPR